MNSEKRYTYWRIFWVVLAVYIFFSAIGFLFLAIAPVPEKTTLWSKMLNWNYALTQLLSFLLATIFYYYTLNVYYRLISKKQPAIDYLKPSVIAFIAICIYYVFNFFFFAREKLTIGFNKMPGEPLPIPLIIFVILICSLFFLGVSLLVAYLTYLRDEKKQRKILEEQKMQLEIEKSQANFNFLKSQINPHFLHNTLNFLYSKALPLSPELSEGILTLSDIMRYALSEGNSKDGKAPLKDEIEHVRNVIKIQQLRFNNNLKVNFSVEGVINGATIIPFVLITLVENAFKHGDLKNNNEPIDIKIKIGNKGGLYFYCRNKKKLGPKELSTGIGLDNIKKRLDLAYTSNYVFNVKDEAEFYTTELIIHTL